MLLVDKGGQAPMASARCSQELFFQHQVHHSRPKAASMRISPDVSLVFCQLFPLHHVAPWFLHVLIVSRSREMWHCVTLWTSDHLCCRFEVPQILNN